jgi:hypothetical protein
MTAEETGSLHLSKQRFLGMLESQRRTGAIGHPVGRYRPLGRPVDAQAEAMGQLFDVHHATPDDLEGTVPPQVGNRRGYFGSHAMAVQLPGASEMTGEATLLVDG